jgi:hypothetical protein
MGGTASETRNNKWSGSDPAPVRRVPSHNTLQRQPTPEPELPQGEPAEALYDYTSNVSITLTNSQDPLFLKFFSFKLAYQIGFGGYQCPSR